MATHPHDAVFMSGSRHGSGRSNLFTGLIFAAGSIGLVFTWDSVLPLLFTGLLAVPIVFALVMNRDRHGAELGIFLRSLATGLLAAGIAAYFANVLFDPYQTGSDARSFYELSSQAGPARTLQDLQTITEGAGAVILWARIYDFAALLGFPREPYIGIAFNIVAVAFSAMLTTQAARKLYGDDEYRFERLALLFTISGNMYLFAGVHIRDSSILLVVTVLCSVWISYLAQLERRRVFIAILATVFAMPVLEVLRKEFFYIPLLIGTIAILCLNFSRGRGDSRFINLVSIIFGAILVGVAIAAFGEQIQDLFLSGQEIYGEQTLADARTGSLGASLIVNQPTLIRIALGVPYLMYFPVPAWIGFSPDSAITFFKSINAFSFYYISVLFFGGALLIVSDRRLSSPAFLFILLVPMVTSVSIALTSLESRHFGVFLPLIFLVSLMPDWRDPLQARILRAFLLVIVSGGVIAHAAWAALRYV